jgi:hypothetical protein
MRLLNCLNILRVSSVFSASPRLNANFPETKGL